jgi:hypothetical protein
MIRRAAIGLLVVCFAAAAAALAQEQESKIASKPLPRAEIDRIIKKVTVNEAAFRGALTNYVFTRDAIVQSIGMGGQVSGQYHRTSFMTFNEDGGRFEKILFFPVPNLQDFIVTPEDLEDLGGINPFALDPSMVSQYNFNYLGTEKIDELNLYVFDVTPKVMPDPKKTKLRLFSGRIWVDQADLMIVKSKGKAVPDSKNNVFPVVETWRENIDGKYWFPTYTFSDDHLTGPDGSVFHLRMKVTYKDYKLGRTDVRILDDDEPVKPTPSPTPKKQ